MQSSVTTIALPAALAVIMLGLGLHLTVADFVRIARTPRTLALALACQLLILPVLAFGLIKLFDLPAALAVGMMLLAASPGGTTANMLSHLFGGDVALNVSLTAINSIAAVVSVPVVTNFALGYFLPAGEGAVGLQFGKTVQVFAVVLTPVALGMLIRWRKPRFATLMDRPARIASATLLGVVVVAALIAERDKVGDYLASVGAVAAVFCVLSLSLGYLAPLVLGIGTRQAIACSMEIGIHNSAVAITVASGVLGNSEFAVPAAVYGILMYPIAGLFGYIISRPLARSRGGDTAALPVKS
ncbi:bile acid:sodium symporter family protein [Nocardia sp. NPDC056952]|uniref:bile acid:sodium symporter family protein n=1 Tax=Nocardia sp. NPDC056952 TaxID=3345979 RepID=UPI00363C72E7